MNEVHRVNISYIKPNNIIVDDELLNIIEVQRRTDIQPSIIVIVYNGEVIQGWNVRDLINNITDYIEKSY